MKSKLLTTVACMAIAMLLLSNVSDMVIAESVPSVDVGTAPGESGSNIDKIYYPALGAGSGTMGGMIGAGTFIKLFRVLMADDGPVLGEILTEWGVSITYVSFGAGVLTALATAAVIFSIGYGIYQAVAG